jgi:hypothetical protein
LSLEATRSELRDRIEMIEEGYEFMLAYAAQGLNTDQASRSGAQLRGFLSRTDAALDGLAELFAEIVVGETEEAAEVYGSFREVLERDARSARAAVRLVLSQPAISSQLVDNLNASIHVRALLTDLFLVDEMLKIGQELGSRAETPG